MPFHPNDLPAPALKAFNRYFKTPIMWPLVVQEAVRAGVRDVNVLTDIVFYMHHWDRILEPIKRGETKLINEWKAFRTLVQKGVPGWSKPSSKPGAATPGAAAGGEAPWKPTSKRELIDRLLGDVESRVKLTAAQKSQLEAILLGTISTTDQINTIVSNLHTYVDLAIDIASLLKYGPVGAPAGSALGVAGSVSWSLGQVLGFIGPFIQFAGFVVALDEAMDADMRVYRAVATAYYITSWAHGDMRPLQSKRVIQNVRDFGYEPDLDRYQKNWRGAQSETKKNLQKAVSGTAGRLSMPQGRAEKVLKIAMSSISRKKLAQGALESIARAYGKTKGGDNEANAILSLAGSLSYPN